MGTKVRILAAVMGYQPNQVVDFPPATAKALAADGQVDPHKDAVSYCIRELGADVVVHVDPAEAQAAAEAAAAKAAAIADLQAKIAAAPDADKPALEAELAKLAAE